MLTKDELIEIETRLNRKPNHTEKSVFDAMWSEHCSYKTSKSHLKRLYTNNRYVYSGPGENAGVISIGGTDRIAFKMESHNHPSYIEPFQGAATGVGGILRDIFTMGFRPIALTNNLFFGDPAFSDDSKRVINGVIKGLTHYGNCVGVPTVSSKIIFHNHYEKNPLVNAMAVGHTRELILGSVAKDSGKLLYVGAKTGRDGIGGAVMASDSFTDGVDLRPTVQVGDPYLEKLLIEACLELAKTGHVIAAQDMGAAGLTSSATEIGIKGGSATFQGKCGIELNLDKVPLRETGMEAWEILLSESQERMLFVLHDWGIEEAKAIFDKWDLDCVEIGHTTEDGNFTVYRDGNVCCNFPLSALEYPELERPWTPRFEKEEVQSEYRFSTENILSQYDSEVQGNTIKGIRDDVAIVRIPKKDARGKDKHIAIYTDSFPYQSYINPDQGAENCIVSIYDKLISIGAKPIALTNCLNFGNPENPEIMFEFKETIDAMARICEKLDFPIISGNVSFYNETSGQNILPTPVFGAIGLMEE